MKKRLLIILPVFIGGIALLFPKLNSIKSEGDKNSIAIISEEERQQYEAYINSHEYSTIKYSTEELSNIPKKDRPDLAWQQNYLATMNPALLRPEPEKLIPVFETTKQIQNSPTLSLPGAVSAPWVERGPDNVGGRTRALAWDPTSANKVWAGGVTGGL